MPKKQCRAFKKILFKNRSSRACKTSVLPSLPKFSISDFGAFFVLFWGLNDSGPGLGRAEAKRFAEICKATQKTWQRCSICAEERGKRKLLGLAPEITWLPLGLAG